MTAKATDDHAHSGQWAETSHCRVSAVRRFGAFTALELVAPGVTANASPGQFVMVTVPGGGFLLRRPLSLFSVHGDRAGITMVSAITAMEDPLMTAQGGAAAEVPKLVAFVSQKTGSRGVGLAIVNAIVRAYGGSTKAYNDNGACIEFSLKNLSQEADCK